MSKLFYTRNFLSEQKAKGRRTAALQDDVMYETFIAFLSDQMSNMYENFFDNFAKCSIHIFDRELRSRGPKSG